MHLHCCPVFLLVVFHNDLTNGVFFAFETSTSNSNLLQFELGLVEGRLSCALVTDLGIPASSRQVVQTL
jgi:hypothetical protein